jgi:hypothetical protein
MSKAREIYNLIQKERDEMAKRWAGWSIEQYPLKCLRDKTCEEIQAKIAEAFPGDFPHLRKEPDSD